jgi:hypothetical protein
MTRQTWNGGDVAMVSALNRTEPYRAHYDSHAKTWRDETGGFCVDQPLTYRPLVVIDPEDEAELRRVAALLVALDRGYDDDSWLDLRDAFREYTSPTPLRCGACISLAGFSYRCEGEQGHDDPHSNGNAKALWGEPA